MDTFGALHGRALELLDTLGKRAKAESLAPVPEAYRSSFRQTHAQRINLAVLVGVARQIQAMASGAHTAG